jgi:hypothetical protein
MSDATDPMIELLTERVDKLAADILVLEARRSAYQELLAELRDGRSRVAKRRKGNMQAIDDVRGILKPDGQGPLPDPLRAVDAP